MGGSQSAEAAPSEPTPTKPAPEEKQRSPPAHNRTVPAHSDADSDDPVESMLRKAGCLEQHYAIQACMSEHSDWRACQEAVEAFKQCMAGSNRRNVVPANRGD